MSATIQDQLKQYLHNLEHHVQVERQVSASIVHEAIQRIEQLEAELEDERNTFALDLADAMKSGAL